MQPPKLSEIAGRRDGGETFGVAWERSEARAVPKKSDKGTLRRNAESKPRRSAEVRICLAHIFRRDGFVVGLVRILMPGSLCK
jgi:hypothetical protein